MDFSLGLLFAFAAVILWSVSDVVTKLALDAGSKWKVLFFGQLFGGLVILLVAWFLGEQGNSLLELLPWMIGIGVVHLVMMYSFYRAMEVKGVALTAPIANSWPFVTVILAVVFYNELINLSQVAAIGLILLGISIITLKKGKIAFDNSFLFALLSMLLGGFFFFSLKIPSSIFGVFLVT